MSYGLFTYRPGGERRLLGIDEIKDEDREIYGRAFSVHPIDNPARTIDIHIDNLYIDELYGSLFPYTHPGHFPALREGVAA